jgi:hypothetical protein
LIVFPLQRAGLNLLDKMAAAMRDWLGPLVESELKAACTSFEGKDFPGRRVEESHAVCGPDVVTVRVKKRGEVQIIEVSSLFPRIFFF